MECKLSIEWPFPILKIIFSHDIQINAITWNCRHAPKRSFGAFIKDLHGIYDFAILILLEPCLSGARADKVAK